ETIGLATTNSAAPNPTTLANAGKRGKPNMINTNMNTELKSRVAPWIGTFAVASFMSLAIAIIADANPEMPAAAQQKPVVQTSGTNHPVSNAEIENGIVVFEKGRLTVIGKKGKIPADAEVIDITGKHVYPGLFESHTNLGLIEINAVRATVDD